MQVAGSIEKVRRRTRTGRRPFRAVSATVGACALAVAVAVAPGTVAPAAAEPGAITGFALPFAGAPQFEYLSPTLMTNPSQLNAPLGQKRADDIAAGIGLTPADALSDTQYRELVSGGGVGGDRNSGQMIEACLRILTNTTGHPMESMVNGNRMTSVVASYGLYVTPDGLLQSPANASAPTRQVNALIAPGGFVGNWLRDNGAVNTLVALYRSAYTVQVPFGFAAQQISGEAQLITNTLGGINRQVGMSMGPPLWIVNFALLYVVKPSIAAAMPAYWAPIPGPVADALKASPSGQVPYGAYAKYFR